MNEIHFTKKDFKVQWFSGTGGGGQHRNKHQNCCRIIHKETGLSAVGQSHRERSSNQKDAFKALAAKLVAHYSTDEERRQTTETIRTYHQPRNSVKDHASGKTSTYKTVVIDGDIEDMVEARHQEMCERQVGD